jgi:hypothetical protein
MVFKFITFSSNVSPVYSIVNYIWRDENTGIYYIDGAGSDSNSLLHPYASDIKTKSYYKEQLSNNAKALTESEIKSGIIDYNKSKWKIDNPNKYC